MRFRRPRLVERTREGTFVLHVSDDIVELLRNLAEQLDPLLDDPSADPGLRRLFPPAHAEDVLAEAAWQIEQGAQLRDSRRQALAALDRAAGDPMTEDELVAWVQGVNALRLVLAERLGVTGDEGEEEAAYAAAVAAAEGDDPERAEAARASVTTWVVYDHLGALVHAAVTALSD